MSVRAVVVAHPDDEILWLSSATAKADRVVFCFGDQFGTGRKSAARRRAVSALGLGNLTDLALTESGTRKLVDWAQPRLTAQGMEIADAAGAARYAANYTALLAALRPVLAGCAEVYTHNPWGEYGHPEHVQVYRAVAALQAELGFTIWFANYAAPLSWALAHYIGSSPCWARRVETRPDLALIRRLFWVYWRHGAWTWPLTYRWPKREMLYAQPPDGAHQPLQGQALLDVSRLRWWRLGSAERVLD